MQLQVQKHRSAKSCTIISRANFFLHPHTIRKYNNTTWKVTTDTPIIIRNWRHHWKTKPPVVRHAKYLYKLIESPPMKATCPKSLKQTDGSKTPLVIPLAWLPEHGNRNHTVFSLFSQKRLLFTLQKCGKYTAVLLFWSYGCFRCAFKSPMSFINEEKFPANVSVNSWRPL